MAASWGVSFTALVILLRLGMLNRHSLCDYIEQELHLESDTHECRICKRGSPLKQSFPEGSGKPYRTGASDALNAALQVGRPYPTV